jgi:hypothetical protein
MQGRPQSKRDPHGGALPDAPREHPQSQAQMHACMHMCVRMHVCMCKCGPGAQEKAAPPVSGITPTRQEAPRWDSV